MGRTGWEGGGTRVQAPAVAGGACAGLAGPGACTGRGQSVDESSCLEHFKIFSGHT